MSRWCPSYTRRAWCQPYLPTPGHERLRPSWDRCPSPPRVSRTDPTSERYGHSREVALKDSARDASRRVGGHPVRCVHGGRHCVHGQPLHVSSLGGITVLVTRSLHRPEPGARMGSLLEFLVGALPTRARPVLCPHRPVPGPHALVTSDRGLAGTNLPASPRLVSSRDRSRASRSTDRSAGRTP